MIVFHIRKKRMSRERGFDQYRVYSKGEGTVWVVALKCSLAYYHTFAEANTHLKKTVLKSILLTQMQGRKASRKKILKILRWNMKLKLPPLTCSSVWWLNTSIKEIWRMCNGWTKIYGCVFIFNLIVILFRN